MLSAVETEAVTGVDCAGASLNVHVHFHLLYLDGIYVSDGDAPSTGSVTVRYLGVITGGA
jgi:hypothetical protein